MIEKLRIVCCCFCALLSTWGRVEDDDTKRQNRNWKNFMELIIWHFDNSSLESKYRINMNETTSNKKRIYPQTHASSIWSHNLTRNKLYFCMTKSVVEDFQGNLKISLLMPRVDLDVKLIALITIFGYFCATSVHP